MKLLNMLWYSLQTNLFSTASMSRLDTKPLSALEKGGLPLTAALSAKRHGHDSAVAHGRISSSFVTAIKYSIPTIYLIYLLLTHKFTVSRTPTSEGVKYTSTSPFGDNDPASEFLDDVFPLRSHDAWDISTDFPYPRTLAYDVEEGTWLRLDVHPISGDIVFDMAGDIYCLPAYAYSEVDLTSGIKTRAIPVLTGVPHDSDPSFSPEGDRLAFRSDAGLGIDNIWVVPWAAGGCSEMDIRSPSTMTVEAIAQRDVDASLLAMGVRETEERRLRRLSQEGRLAGLCYLEDQNASPADHPCDVQLCASLMRHIIGSPTHIGTLRVPRSLLRNGTFLNAPWVRGRAGNMKCLPSMISSSAQWKSIRAGVLFLGCYL